MILAAGWAAADDDSNRGADAAEQGCTITGYKTRYESARPAYAPDSKTRSDDLGQRITFPIDALQFDVKSQRFLVAVAAPDAGGEAEYAELRRKHVSFDGPSCPGAQRTVNTIRCQDSLTLANRGSNPVYCERVTPDDP